MYIYIYFFFKYYILYINYIFSLYIYVYSCINRNNFIQTIANVILLTQNKEHQHIFISFIT